MYCVRCGKKLPGEYNKCVKCRKDARENAWYCPECGNGVKKTAKECDVCKAKLNLSPENYVYPPRKQGRSKKKAVTLAFALGFSGAHLKYLGFDKKFIKRAVWAAVSVAVSIACLIAFQTGMDAAFVGGEYNAEIGDSLVSFAITTAAGIVAGGVSFLIDWGIGIADGIKMLTNPKYEDNDGQYLE